MHAHTARAGVLISTYVESSTQRPTLRMTSQIDNPATSGEVQPPFLAQPAIRETTEVQRSGFMMLVPPPAPRYLLVPDELRRQLRVFVRKRPWWSCR